MQKITLVIIYNHNYEKHIERIEEIYFNRFHKIYHLIPFYQGNKKNVIKIYGTSYLFQDYIRQGFPYYKNDESSHYCFIADDMILSPHLGQHNISEKLGLDDNTAYITCIQSITYNMLNSWLWTTSVYRSMENNKSCLCDTFLPSLADARSCFKNHSLEPPKITKEGFLYLKQFFAVHDSNFFLTQFVCNKLTYFKKDCRPPLIRTWKNFFKNTAKMFLCFLRENKKQFFKNFYNSFQENWEKFPSSFKTEIFKYAEENFQTGNYIYPLAKGYSDFFIVPHKIMDNFVDKVGILASKNIFVEAAIPTALVLSAQKINVQKDTHMKSCILWTKKNIDALKKMHQSSLQSLLDSCRENDLIFHPIKLSQWYK